jgi:hypothetical protein
MVFWGGIEYIELIGVNDDLTAALRGAKVEGQRCTWQ